MDEAPTPFVRPHAVRPLILAAAAYPAMEELALGARSTLFLAFRIFDPTVRLKSVRATELGLVTWLDLLKHRAAAGVSVRLLLADFDPLFAPGLHAGTASSIEALAPLIADAAVDVDAHASFHPGELGSAWRTALWPLVRRKLAAQRGGRVRLWPPQRLWPASHHMKMIVADASAMVIGGLDLDERRWDDPNHNRPAEETWHDVSLRVEGPAAAEGDAFIRTLWNTLAIPQAKRENGRALKPMPKVLVRPTDSDPQLESVSFQYTASRPSRSPLARGPLPAHATMMHGLEEVIARARRMLYIENQFLRDPEVGARLARALEAAPELEIIIVTPAAPDVVVFDGDRGDSAQHGEFLQLSLLDGLTERYGDRVGVFMLAGSHSPKAAADMERATTAGRGIVYLHSKVMIADDVLAHVSSANLNARSLRMDTEAGVLWRDPDGVKAFREALWRKHLGGSAPDLDNALRAWKHAAASNRDPGPAERSTTARNFVVPWDRATVARFARRRWYIPTKFL